MKKILLLLTISGIYIFSFSQEICDNGIDDDGDNLIDLNDSLDCPCNGINSATAISLLANPSFEDYSCCPSSWTQMSCADTWIQASNATTDYLNTCDYIGNAPLPFPDGNGAAAMITTDSWTEYAGTFLQDSLIQGEGYIIDLYAAFRFLTGTVGNCTTSTVLPPIDFTIFGTEDTAELPFSGYSYCPVDSANWIELASINIDPVAIENIWTEFTTVFTSPANIKALAFGGPCIFPAGGIYDSVQYGCLPFFFIDNIILNSRSEFHIPIGKAGRLCSNDLSLFFDPDTIGTYQWYYEGIALTLEKDTFINISANSYPMGKYTVVFSYGNERSSGSIIIDSIPPLDNSILNMNDTLIANANGFYYQWIDCNNGNQPIIGETNQSFIPVEDGSYAVIISDSICSVTSDCIFFTQIELQNSILEKQIKVYPNPFNDIINIDLININDCQIEIFDNMGKLLVSERITNRQMTIDLSKYPTGLYLFKFISDGSSVTKKIQKK